MSSTRPIADSFALEPMGENFAFARGRVALFAVLKALGVEPDDEVILTGFTCVVVANSVQFLGAKCRYVDIDSRTYGTNPGQLGEVWSPRTKAMVVQHSFGIPAAMEPIMAWARETSVPVIEDCALTLGSKYKGQQIGSFGAAAFWSGQWSKPLPVGAGGFLKVNDPELVEAVRAQWEQASRPAAGKQVSLIVQAALRKRLLTSRRKARLQSFYRELARRRVIGPASAPREVNGHMPANFFARAGVLQSWAWRRGLRHWDRDIIHRCRIVMIYEESLPAMGFETVDLSPYEEVVYSRYPVRVSNKQEVLRAAEREAVEIGDWMDQPLHEAEAPLETWDYRMGMCPVGEKAARETINLPTHHGVSDKEARRVLRFLEHIARPAQRDHPKSKTPSM